MPAPSAPPRTGTQTKLSKKPAAKTNPLANPAAKTPQSKSILSFFKKVPPPEESLFVAATAPKPALPPGQTRLSFPTKSTSEPANELAGIPLNDSAKTSAQAQNGVDKSRFNEYSTANKRRRLSHNKENSTADDFRAPIPEKSVALMQTRKPQAPKGPFVDDSDEDSDEDAKPPNVTAPGSSDEALHDISSCDLRNGFSSFSETFAIPVPQPNPGSKKRQAEESGLSVEFDFEDGSEYGGLDGIEGEEFRERRYMLQQALLESGKEPGLDMSIADATDTDDMGCPICGANLSGRTPEQATVHVNACLDGASVPAGAEETSAPDTPSMPQGSNRPTTPMSKRFLRYAEPRPAQANPIDLGGAKYASGGAAIGPAGSAFAKLMSGHAEDAAWASAAAAETAARGRPAYDRTCPFYKIMPGAFSAITVDAFRYGAIAGCRAYFLSHFHSDHYIGLTARWAHGPIYCSHTTASLVRTQLGTAAKHVVGLDFDVPVDVPGTGVSVTMISANHCPGSSLFLFKANGQRILHCGDFRACRAHIEHPLLRPSTVDTVTKRTLRQKIDICYLDTTYLNPRYAFPPQDDVVAACASLCARLDRSMRAGCDDEWDRAMNRKRGQADSGNVKAFFQKTEDAADTVEHPEANAFTAITAQSGSDGRPKRMLVVCGTYSIGKERICKAIALAMGTKIYASPHKLKIVAQLNDPELSALMTSRPGDAQVHMQALGDLRPETLSEYLAAHRAHFTHVVGFRPSGWSFKAAAASASLSPSSLDTPTLLHAPAWRTRYGIRDLLAQRGSTREVLCFGVPYSEHSSFRELALFIMALHIDKIVPTVNVGSDASRKRMKAWTDRWLSERRRGGLVEMLVESEQDAKDVRLWDGKDGLGGQAYW